MASSTRVRYASVGAMVVLAFLGWVNANPGGGQYQAYPLRYGKAVDVEAQLVELLRYTKPTPHIVADSRDNQILLRGSEAAHRIAKQFIDSVDQPPVAKAAPKPAAQAIVKAYRCKREQLADITMRLKKVHARRSDVRVTSEPQTSQIVVLAPPEVHKQIASDLASVSTATATGSTPRKLPSTPQYSEHVIELNHVRSDEFERQFRRLLGSRLEPLHGRVAGQSEFAFVSRDSRRVEIALDRQRNQVRLLGVESIATQLARLIRTIDASGKVGGPDAAIRIVPVHRADPAKVREAVDAYRKGAKEPATRRTVSDVPDSQDTSRNGPRGRQIIALVQHTAPAKADDAENGASEPRRIPAAPEGIQREDRLSELDEKVEIETLPDLDVIILRGRDHAVDEVSRIIAELERLSAETVPVIDIYQLRHVHCMSLVTIIELVAEDLIGGRQGKIHVTPLVKPNAMLLIGWGEAVTAMKELIAKLDQPVLPETQVRVYRLRHLPVAEAQGVLEQAFADPQGLGPKVDVTADVRTNSLIVRASPRDLLEVNHLITKLDQGTSGIVSQARVFKLNNSLAMDLATTLQSAITAASGGPGGQRSAILELLTADVQGQRLLKSGVLRDVQITPDPHTNSLLIAAPAESMDLLAALIEQLDSPTAVAQIKVFEIVNGDASSLIEMLRTLLPAETMVAGPQLAGAEGETTLVPVRFSVDVRTNSIIATGSQGDLAILEALLLRLDQEDVEQRKNEVYRLKNAPALDVAMAVNEFLRSERQLQQEAAGVVSPFEQIEREVVVVPEPVSNSLILSATPRFFEEIMTLVKDIDKEPDQVMIQVVIAEVRLRDIDEFGIELGLQDSVLFDRSLLEDIETVTQTDVVTTPGGGFTTITQQLIASALNTPGFAFNNGGALGNSGATGALEDSHQVGGQGLSYFSTQRTNDDVGYSGLILSASSESVSVLLRALRHLSTIQILGRPQIMTLDNQPAFIQVGERVPRIVSSRFDGRVQTNQVDLENTGLILGVTPRISPEGMVVMEIDAEKSALNEEEGIVVSVVEGREIKSPRINVTIAQTTVSASSGETIVLGGLITKNTEMIRRRVPYLSDIPVLGHLFRYDKDDVIRTELLIFLTPHVVGSPEDLDRIKQAEAARMNWCLADVHEIHGPTGIYEEGETYFYGQGEVVYPDRNPNGLAPGEFQPQEMPMDELELSPPIKQIPTPAEEPEPVPTPATPEPESQTYWRQDRGVMPAGYATPLAPAAPPQMTPYPHPPAMQPHPERIPIDRRW